MKILSVGAALLDQVARVEKFPKEDDEVFVSELKLLPGGSAANFSVICSRLGVKTGFLGKVGADFFGDYLVDNLKSEGVDVRAVARSRLPTGTVFVVVRSDGQRMMFAHSGAANNLLEKDINLAYLKQFEHLHLADLKNTKALIYAARKFDGTVSLNPGALMLEKPQETLRLLKLVDILICSKNEAVRLSGDRTTKRALEALCGFGPSIVVATFGSKGSVAFDGKRMLTSPAFKARVVDTTGAGDAFSAAFVCRYLEGNDLSDSLRFANAAASIVVQHSGARGGLKSRKQVEALLHR